MENNEDHLGSRAKFAFGLCSVAAGLLAGSIAAPAVASETPAFASPQSFDIPSQPLDSALTELADRAGLKLLYHADTARQARSHKVTGNYTPQQALDIMLHDTGLSYRLTDDGALTIEKPRTEFSTESLLAEAGEFELVKAEPEEKPWTGPVEQLDMKVLGGALDGYAAVTASTAMKTDTPIMETPVSVQVVPRTVMDDQKVTRITEALENVSGVRPQSSMGTGTGFIVRGFRNPSVYRNGLLAVPGGFRTEFDSANIESVEVLKGPASILYGRIEPGGLINVNIKKPLDTPHYSLEQRFGSYNFYRTEWDATGSITDDKSLLYRFTGSYQNNESFRDFVSNDRILISPSITWRPTDATDITLNVEGVTQDYQADYGIPALGKRPANIPIERSFGDPNDPFDSLHKVLVSTELNHRFNEDWAVHSRFLANFSEQKETFLNPTPAFGNALNPNTGILQRNVFSQHNDNETYSTNLDLTGKFFIGGTQHDILVGYDYFRGFSKYNTQGFYNNANPALDINIYNPGPSYGIDPSVFSNAVSTTELSGRNFSLFKNEWHGVYFHDHITLWDKLHILGGGRYDWAQTGRGSAGSFEAAENALPAAIRKDEGFSPRVGVLYQPWEWVSLFGNWTTSFGANNGISATGESFDPQIGEQFEAGIKTQLFDQRLTATLAYYHLTLENILTPDLTASDPNARVAIGEQRSQGIELDVLGQITDELSVIGSYAFTDARITKDNRTLNGVVQGYEGNRLTNVPEHSGSLWLRYDVKRYAPLDGLSFGIGTFAAGQRQGDNENSFQLPGYVRLDAFTAYQWKVGDSKLTAQFNIRNLLNKTYYESTDPDANVAPRNGIYPGAPLTAMGSIRLEY
ncbi:TonB-dependent siderophore receptor [Methylotuvimicrobium buryatense]|uniref:TonB-dependent receptor n=1 Tax=Methylotuvimicrobium buryatense TaxID=95641 RepID=A0A4P9UJ97_METBY|nr:TonB-dependent receptor [Methylotuvimicrobium buryatense]QCW81138.1 TonB-dependent receptor [Methylotuvimicrobium buryatense]